MTRSGQGLIALVAIAAAVAGAACVDGSAANSAAGAGAGAGAADKAGSVAGRVGDRTFSLEEVDRAAMKANMQVFQQVYDARRQALETLIADELLARAAKAEGIDVEELVAREIDSKVPAVTDAAIRGFFDQNQNRMGGRTFEQVEPQIRDYLGAMNAQQARESYLEGLRSTATITRSIDPPRVEVVLAANDPAKGPPDAKVTIVEYSDFQ